MAKYHIGRDGTPKICHAQPGNCKLGQHFDNLKDAQKESDRRGQAMLSSASKLENLNTSALYPGEQELLERHLKMDRASLELAIYRANNNSALPFKHGSFDSVPTDSQQAYLDTKGYTKENFMRDKNGKGSEQDTKDTRAIEHLENGEIDNADRKHLATLGFDSQEKIDELQAKSPFFIRMGIRKARPKEMEFDENAVHLAYRREVDKECSEILKRPGVLKDDIDTDPNLTEEQKFSAHVNKITSQLKKDGFKTTRDPHKAIYYIDGKMISGGFETGNVRTIDHESLRSNLNMRQEDLTKYGNVIVPESNVYIGAENKQLERAGYTRMDG